VSTDEETDRLQDSEREVARNPTSSPTDENPGLLSILRRHLMPGEVFLDVGANVGVFAIDIALHLGSRGKVYAFEPGADAAQALRDNAERFGVADRIAIFQMALGSRTDRLMLHADPQNPLDWSKRSLFLNGPIVGEVSVRAFDELVETGDITLPQGLQAVKVDVEGAEAAVLRGMSNTLRVLRPRILVIETISGHQARAGSSIGELDALVGKLRYLRLPAGPEVPSFVFNTVYVYPDRKP
jgi:FkbM family methyltransferase